MDSSSSASLHQLQVPLLTSPYPPILQTAIHDLSQTKTGIECLLTILQSPSKLLSSLSSSSSIFNKNSSFESLSVDPNLLPTLIYSEWLSYAHQSYLLVSTSLSNSTSFSSTPLQGSKVKPKSKIQSTSSSYDPWSERNRSGLATFLLPKLLLTLPKLSCHSEALAIGLEVFLCLTAIQCLQMSDSPSSPSHPTPIPATPMITTSVSSPLITLVETLPFASLSLWQTLLDSYLLLTDSLPDSSSSFQRLPVHLLYTNLAFCQIVFQLTFRLILTASLSSSVLSSQKLTSNNKLIHASFISVREKVWMDWHQFYSISFLPAMTLSLSSPSSSSITLFNIHHTCLSTLFRLFLALPPLPQDPFVMRPKLLASWLSSLPTVCKTSFIPQTLFYRSFLMLLLFQDLLLRKQASLNYISVLQLVLHHLPSLLELNETPLEEPCDLFDCVLHLWMPVLAYAVWNGSVTYPLILQVLTLLQSKWTSLLPQYLLHPQLRCFDWLLPLLQLQVHPHSPIAQLAQQLYSLVSKSMVSIASKPGGLFSTSLSSSLPSEQSTSFSQFPLLNACGDVLLDIYLGCPYLTLQTPHRILCFPSLFSKSPMEAQSLFMQWPLSLVAYHGHALFLFFSSLLNIASKPVLDWLFIKAFPKLIHTKQPWLLSKLFHLFLHWTRLTYPYVAIKCFQSLEQACLNWSRCWRGLRQALLGYMDTELRTRSSQGHYSSKKKPNLRSNEEESRLRDFEKVEEDAVMLEQSVAQLIERIVDKCTLSNETEAWKEKSGSSGGMGLEEEELVVLLHRFLQLPKLSACSRFHAVRACLKLAPYGSNSDVIGFWTLFLLPMLTSLNLHQEIEHPVFEAILRFFPYLFRVSSTTTTTSSSIWKTDVKKESNKAKTSPSVSLDLETLFLTWWYPYLPLPPLEDTSIVSSFNQQEYNSCISYRPKSPLASTHLAARTLLALTSFPSAPEILGYLVLTSCTVKDIFNHLASLLYEDHPNDSVWENAIYEFLRWVVSYELEYLIPRSVFTVTHHPSSTPLPSSIPPSKFELSKQTWMQFKDRFLEYCSHAPSMAQGSIKAALLILSPTQVHFPSNLPSLSFTSSWQHRLLPLSFWCDYWKPYVSSFSSPSKNFYVSVFQQYFLVSTPLEKTHVLYASTGYVLALHSHGHSDATQLSEFLFQWLCFRFLGHTKLSMVDQVASLLPSSCFTQDTAELQNNDIRACVISCLASLCGFTGEEEEVSSLVDYCFEAIVGDSDWAGFDASIAICMILSCRFSLRANVPNFVYGIQSFLELHCFDSSLAVKPLLGLAIGVAYLQWLQPAAIPSSILKEARLYLTSSNVSEPLFTCCATWILGYSSIQADSALVSTLFPPSGLTWDQLGTYLGTEDPFLLSTLPLVLGRLQFKNLDSTTLLKEVQRLCQFLQHTTGSFQTRLYALLYTWSLLGFDLLHPLCFGFSSSSSASTILTTPTLIRWVQTLVDIGLKKTDPRVAKVVIPLVAYVVNQWIHSFHTNEKEDVNVKAIMFRHMNEPTDYTRLDASKFYLRCILDFIHPASLHVRSYPCQASLFEHILNKISHPFPSLDWYPILSALNKAGYLNVTWTFASLHMTSSYSCLDYIWDLFFLPSKSLPLFNLMVSSQGFPLLLSLPSSISSEHSFNSTSLPSRGRKGAKVILTEEKKLHAFQWMLVMLFPCFPLDSTLILKKQLESPPSSELTTLQTAFLKNISNNEIAMHCILHTPSLVDLLRRLHSTVDLSLTQLEALIPFFKSMPLDISTKQSQLMTGFLFLKYPNDILKSGRNESQKEMALLQLLRSVMLEYDPEVYVDLHHHFEKVIFYALPHSSSLFTNSIQTSGSSSSSSSSSTKDEAATITQKRLDWLLRLLDLLLFLTTQATKLTDLNGTSFNSSTFTTSSFNANASLTLRSVHYFLDHYLLPFLISIPSSHRLHCPSFAYSFQLFLDSYSAASITKVLKKMIGLALLPKDPLNWKPMLFHLCAKYRYLDLCKSDWKQWVSFGELRIKNTSEDGFDEIVLI